MKYNCNVRAIFYIVLLQTTTLLANNDNDVISTWNGPFVNWAVNDELLFE